MSDNGRHTEGLLVSKFCTQRKDKCTPCGNKYKDVIKSPSSPPSAQFKYPQLKALKSGLKTLQMSQEAHHLLCVAEVTKVISKDEKIQRVVKQSVYCINRSVNMIALPLFAHTVHWYCTQEGITRSVVGSVSTSLQPPPFANLPNHNYDHSLYNAEVETELNDLKAEIQEADHDYDSNDLAPTLDALSEDFRQRLSERGQRQGGTHQAWLDALEEKNDRWYEPYSLAADGDVTDRTFPGRAFSAEFAKVLERLMNAILNV